MRAETEHRQPLQQAPARLDGIQALRGLAALGVLIHHALEQSNGAPPAQRFSPDWLTTAGAAGVDIFFVISGVIMMHVCLRPGRPVPRPGPFLWRRAARIYPLYWICLCGMLVPVGLGHLQGLQVTPGSLLRAVLLLPNDRPVIGIAWTLVFEMYFYLIFALSLMVSLMVGRDRGGAPGPGLATQAAGRCVLLCIALLALGAGIGAGMAQGPWRGLLTHPIVWEFTLGLGLGWALQRGHLAGLGRLGGGARACLATLALAAICTAPLIVPHEGTGGLPGWGRVFGWGLPACLLTALCLAWSPLHPGGQPGGRPEGVARVPAGRHMVGRGLIALGDASYALYLTHVFWMVAYGMFTARNPAPGPIGSVIGHWPITLGFILVSVPSALLVHRLIERPLLRWMQGPGRESGRTNGQAPDPQPRPARLPLR